MRSSSFRLLKHSVPNLDVRALNSPDYNNKTVHIPGRKKVAPYKYLMVKGYHSYKSRIVRGGLIKLAARIFFGSYFP